MNSYENFIPTKENVETDAIYTFNGKSKEEIPELLRDRAYANTLEFNGKKMESWYASIHGDELMSMYEQQEAAPATEPVGKTEELPTTEANPFEELASASKLKGTAKTTAIKDLKQKYGPDYNRISKIDTNFARIVKTLEKNNLINKDC
jgi:hypothetical protein